MRIASLKIYMKANCCLISKYAQNTLRFLFLLRGINHEEGNQDSFYDEIEGGSYKRNSQKVSKDIEKAKGVDTG